MVYECEICGGEFQNPQALKMHIKWKHDKATKKLLEKNSFDDDEATKKATKKNKATNSIATKNSYTKSNSFSNSFGEEKATKATNNSFDSEEDEDCCLNCGGDIVAIENLGGGKLKVRCEDCNAIFVWRE